MKGRVQGAGERTVLIPTGEGGARVLRLAKMGKQGGLEVKVKSVGVQK